MIFNVLDYGAVGDGISNDTVFIQAAIDACADNGGGKVLFDGGHVYRSGKLVLSSHVELHFESGAVLKASDCIADFSSDAAFVQPEALTVPTYDECDYTGEPSLFFIYAKDASDISITGQGVIDGNEEIFYGTVTKWHIDGFFYPRVPLIFLENIQHLTISDVTLRNSAFWTTHLVGCSDVLISGVRILNNLRLANCDGIDPDHCKNVRIIGCNIESADDCIVFKNTVKATQYGPCENITVSGCTLKSTSAAIKFGTESEGTFRNISVTSCNIIDSNRGISLQLRDSGNIENISFANINISTRLFSPKHWWGNAEPIAITAVRRKKGSKLGKISGISFADINCRGENGILIYGEESGHIDNIRFNNVDVTLTDRTDWPKRGIDLRPCEGNTILDVPFEKISVTNASNVIYN